VCTEPSSRTAAIIDTNSELQPPADSDGAADDSVSPHNSRIVKYSGPIHYRNSSDFELRRDEELQNTERKCSLIGLGLLFGEQLRKIEINFYYI